MRRNWGFKAGLFALLGAISACSGNVEKCGVKSSGACAPSGTSSTSVHTGMGVGGGDGGGNDIGVSESGATADEVTHATAICGQSEDGVKSVKTQDELVSLLVGRWLHCQGTVVFGRDNDTAGVRIDPDGSWRFLLPGPDGTLVDGKGFDNVGTWSIEDDSVENGSGAFQFQVDIELPGIGGNGIFPVFATSPPKMRWSTMLGPNDYASLDHD